MMKNKRGTRACMEDRIKNFVPYKRSQGWGLDLIVAGVIFLTGIIVFYSYAINSSSQSQKNLEELFYEGGVAAELILSDSDSGILTGDKVNQTKLDEYNASYVSKKDVLGLTHDFYFYIDDLEINGAPASYVGAINTSEAENSIQITRITIYKEKPAKLQLYIWGRND